MIKTYDRYKKRLNITLGEVTYDLVLRPHITQICDEGATGKTMLVKGLKLEHEVCEYIASDRENQYLIMGRTGLPLHISPNYYGQFENVKGVIRIHYDYSVKGWF